jgi:predicted AAA+ superfamily ATPase
MRNKTTRKREIDGLKSGIIELKPKESLLITWADEGIIPLNVEEIEKDSNVVIKIVPAWKWLLAGR